MDLINKVFNLIILFDSFLKVKSDMKLYHYFEEKIEQTSVV